MTSRTRIFNALKGEKVDRVPWIPLCYRDYFLSISDYRKKFPLKWQESEAVSADLEEEELEYRVNFYKNIGADFMNWGPMGCFRTELQNVNSKKKQKDNNIVIIYETPHGDIDEAFSFSNPSQTLFRKDFLIKKEDDFQVYNFILENTVFKTDMIKANRFLEIVGDNGVIFLDGVAPPIHYWVNDLLGIEKLSYAVFDGKKELIELLKIQERINEEKCKALSLLPMKAFLHQATWDVGNVSFHYFENYYLPYLKRYNEILHEKEKICIDHISGQRVKPFLVLIEVMGLDALYGLTFPTLSGDVQVKDLVERWKSKKMVPIFGINCDLLANSGRSNIVETTTRLLDEAGEGPFILGSADDIVYGTPVKNLELVSDTVKKFYG